MRKTSMTILVSLSIPSLTVRSLQLRTQFLQLCEVYNFALRFVKFDLPGY